MDKSSMWARGVIVRTAFALCVAALPGMAAAQAAGGASAPSAEQGMDKLRERLKLTPEQEPQLRALMQTQGQKMKAIDARYGGNASREARINRAREMRGVQEEFRGSLTQILTPEQVKEWDAMRDEAMRKARARQGGPS